MRFSLEFLKTAAVILTLAFASAPAHATHQKEPEIEPIDIVIDLDDTGIRWIHPGESREGTLIPKSGRITQEYSGAPEEIPVKQKFQYRVLDGFPELLQSLSEIPGVRISIFSLGPADRNRRVLRALKLPNGKSAWDITYRVLDRNDGTVVDYHPTAVDKDKQEVHFVDVLKKNLLKINPKLNQVLIVEDSKKSPLPDQYGNVLWIGDKPKKFPATVEDSASAQEFVTYRNRMAFARGLIGRVLKLAQEQSISPKEALAQIDIEALRTDPQIYREGAIEFHRVNPDYRFTSAAGVVDSITCIRSLVEEGLR